jgi:regulatory protein
MARRRGRRERPPLDQEKLSELALTYVGRFATTRAKLESYLARKLRERGWGGDVPPDVDSIADRLMRLGYVDDAAWALSKSRSLTSRGYGERRVREALRAAGVAEEDSHDARELALSEKVEAALHFARRRRIGPFAKDDSSPADRQRAMAAMVRAGHSFSLAKAILSLEPGEIPDIQVLAERA